MYTQRIELEKHYNSENFVAEFFRKLLVVYIFESKKILKEFNFNVYTQVHV